MNPVEVILAKRRGEEHAHDDLEAFVLGFVGGEIPDYQVAAWLMAVCWRGMSERETADLTRIMAASGDQLDLAALPHTLDKHSTGGVGDKTTIVLAPLVASLGGTIAKMSGRGLGHTGGTIDKLESIPGFRATLSESEFLRQARDIGVAVTGQSGELAPADGLLYALRDATATVASVPLIASSVMSKKLASGARSLVLDVKVGHGAFMKSEEEARALAGAMVAIGRHAGRNVRAVLSNMDEPLGNAVGHAVEVIEALATLRGDGPPDVRALVLVLATEVLQASGLDLDEGDVAAALADGRAAERFERWIAAQGGDVSALDALEVAPNTSVWRATSSGELLALDAERVGLAVARLGGGRRRKGDAIDLAVGAHVHVKVGDHVSAGDALVTLLHRGGSAVEDALLALEGAARIGSSEVRRPLVLDVVR
ncbi:MAG: thymidine phosphorylase [Trueperaceae bacterium]|nr:thymidine phosphorylase [Trueperaceae bacterium]